MNNNEMIKPVEISKYRKLFRALLIVTASVLLLNVAGGFLNSIEFTLFATKKFNVYVIIHMLTWILVGWFITVVINVFLWEGHVKRKIEKVPQLLKTSVNVLVYLVIVMIIVGAVFQKSINTMLATTGVMGIIIGFALRGVLESLINSAVLNIERAIRINDVIYMRGGVDKMAKVVEITFRNTYLEDTDGNLLIVPNNTICSIPIVNYSRPINRTLITSLITLNAWGVPIEKAKLLIRTAMTSVSEILSEPPPFVLVSDIVDGNVKYEMRFWVKTSRSEPVIAKDKLYSNIMRYLRAMGLDPEVTGIKYRDRLLNVVPNPQVIKSRILRNIPLFNSLTEEEIEFLANQLIPHEYNANYILIKQGEVGDSMFICVEGLLEVFIQSKDQKKNIPVGYIVPGQFFGEMSLFLGEPRSATIIAKSKCHLFEIKKETMQKLFESNPDMVQMISNKITERHIINLEKEKKLSHTDKIEKDEVGLGHMFLSKIKSWFGQR